MKKFLQSAFLFLTAFYLCWVTTVNLFPTFFKSLDFLSWDYKFNQLPLDSFNGATIIFGDSTAEAGLNPKVLEKEEKVFNLALPGGTVFDSYLLLKRMLIKGYKPKRVLLVYSSYNYAMDGGLSQRGLNFNVYSFDEVAELLKWQIENEFLYTNLNQFEKTAKYFPFNLLLSTETKAGKYRAAWLEYILSRLRLSLLDYQSFKSYLVGKTILQRQFVDTTISDLKKYNGHANYFKVPFVPDEYPIDFLAKEFKVHPFSKFFLWKILNMLKGENIPVSVLYFPMPEYYFKNTSNIFKKTFQEFYDEIESQFGVEVEKEMYWAPQDVLIDDIHLNPQGVKIFSNKVKGDYF